MKNFNFKQTTKLNWFTISIGVSILLAFILFKNWHIDQNFLGIVESKSHVLGAQEPGKVHKMLVLIGDRVKHGQVLAMLDISDLKATVSHLNEELSTIKNSESARRDHSTILVQNLRLQLENEASDLMDRLSLIEAKSTELSGLNREIERLKNAEEAGLGYSRGLSDLVVQRDALASYLREQSKDLDTQNKKLAQARKSRNLLDQADENLLAVSFFAEEMEHAERLKRLLSETEHRIKQRTIIAPCDGYVTEILARSGDVVQEFSPIVTIDEIKPRFLTIYIPEKSTMEIRPGDNVEINSSRDSRFNTTGSVVFVHPGVSMVGDRISFRGQYFWARKVRVALSKDHNLIPGELVTTRIEQGSFSASVYSDSINNIDADSLKGFSEPGCSKISEIKIADKISQSSRFEPSGIAWLPELNRILVASDDTGIKGDKSEHSSKLFLMDQNGVLDNQPILLSGIDKIKDIEAIAAGGNAVYWLVSSQNISKNGNRPVERELIIKAKYQDGKLSVVDIIALLTLLEKSYSRQTLIDLGLTEIEKDGRPLLNIEGAAFFNNTLYLGLKEPVAKDGAIIWKLEDPDKIFDGKPLKENQLSVYGYVKLEEYNKHAPGISDLFVDKNGKMWMASTIANVKTENQMGGFYSIDSFDDGLIQARKYCSFAGLKPEGITKINDDQFMIVFDNDVNTPFYCLVDVEDK